MQGASTVRSSLLNHDTAAAALQFQRSSRCSARNSIRESRFTTFDQHYQPRRQLHNLSCTQDFAINQQNHNRSTRHSNHSLARNQANASHPVRHASTTSQPSTASTSSKPSQSGPPATPKRVIPIRQRAGPSPRQTLPTSTPSPIIIAKPETISGTTEVPIITLAKSNFRLPDPLYPAIDLSTDYRALWYKHTPDLSYWGSVLAYRKRHDDEDKKSHEQRLTRPNPVRKALIHMLYRRQLIQESTTASPLLTWLVSGDLTRPKKPRPDRSVYWYLAGVYVVCLFIKREWDALEKEKSLVEERPRERGRIAPLVGSDDEFDGTSSRDSTHDSFDPAVSDSVKDSDFDVSVPSPTCATEVDRTMRVEQLSDVLDPTVDPTTQVEQLSDFLNQPPDR